MVRDPSGATIGMWQPGQHEGIAVVAEPAAPAWFELWTLDFVTALAFYREVFGWTIHIVSDTDEFRYATLVSSKGEPQAGVMDATSFCPPGTPGQWSVYFAAEDVDATLEKAIQLGGKVVREPEDTPHGRLAVATDSTGASFKLTGPNKA
jgi:predicted enzyme related to lactoylglutathione lyase